MYTSNDWPDLGGLIRVLGFLAVIAIVLGGYELVRLAIWLFNHVRFV